MLALNLLPESSQPYLAIWYRVVIWDKSERETKGEKFVSHRDGQKLGGYQVPTPSKVSGLLKTEATDTFRAFLEGRAVIAG